MIADFDWLPALGGGVLIGLAATLLLGGIGRIAGISGILGGALERPRGDTAWRWLFLLAMVAGALLHRWFEPAAVVPRTGYPVFVLLIAGLIVGVGTRLGSGCTSGHGVCGVARFSPRSIAATVVFIATGMVTVWLVRHGLAGG